MAQRRQIRPSTRSALNMTSGTSPPLDAQRDRHRHDRRFHSDSRARSDNVVTCRQRTVGWRFRPEYVEPIAVSGSGTTARRSEWRTTETELDLNRRRHS